MRTIQKEIYQYDELSDEAKEQAVESCLDICTNHEWWESTFDDACQIGIKITGFDIDRGSYCKGDFTEYAPDCAKLIIKNHGKDCETYKTAVGFLKEVKSVLLKFPVPDNEEDDDFSYDREQEIENLEHGFHKEILEDYRILLSNEFDWITSEEQIIESIKSNEMEFTKEGNPY